MKKYIVTIEETVSEDFVIEAESPQEARRIVTEKYNSGDLALEPGNLIEKKVSVSDANDTLIDYEEF
jgi:hypothetical protein